jgi:hypothetical protein
VAWTTLEQVVAWRLLVWRKLFSAPSHGKMRSTSTSQMMEIQRHWKSWTHTAMMSVNLYAWAMWINSWTVVLVDITFHEKAMANSWGGKIGWQIKKLTEYKITMVLPSDKIQKRWGNEESCVNIIFPFSTASKNKNPQRGLCSPDQTPGARIINIKGQ